MSQTYNGLTPKQIEEGLVQSLAHHFKENPPIEDPTYLDLYDIIDAQLAPGNDEFALAWLEFEAIYDDERSYDIARRAYQTARKTTPYEPLNEEDLQSLVRLCNQHLKLKERNLKRVEAKGWTILIQRVKERQKYYHHLKEKIQALLHTKQGTKDAPNR